MLRFTIRELLLLTLWVAILCAVLLAMGAIYADESRPWYLDRPRLWRLAFLNVGTGVAVGGITGSLLHAPWRGPLIGVAIGFVAEVCWELCLATAMAGIG